MIKIIKTEFDFQELEVKWNNLFRSNQLSTPFQSFEFNWYSWIHILQVNTKNRLWIFTQSNDKNSIIAIVPLYIDQRGILRFINDLHLDFGDGLFDDEIQMFNLTKHVIDLIKKDSQVKGLRLSNLTDTSRIFSYFKSSLKESFAFSTTEHSFLPRIKENRIEESSHLRAKERNGLLKASSIQGLKNEIVDVSMGDFPMREFLEIKKKMISQGLRDADFLNSGMLSLIEDLYKKGLLKICLTKKEDSIVAVNTVIIHPAKKWSMFWVSQYSNEMSLSNISSYNFFINSVLKDKDATIDFGRGGYNYKFKNYLPIVRNVYELIWAKNYYQLFLVFIRFNWFFLKKNIKARLRGK